MNSTPLGWLGILRLGLVQFALGAVTALTTSTLNRLMVVEGGLPAALPAALVAWHYGVQLSRPRWGHGADGGRRTPFIIAGMGVLALGALIATDAALLVRTAPIPGLLVGLAGYTLVGAGIGASGTSLLALLAARTAPERRASAAALAWILMIFGIVAASIILAVALRPFSPERLASAASLIAGGAFLLTLAAVFRTEGAPQAAREAKPPKPPFAVALRDVFDDPLARRFTLFVFVAMLAYSAQELVLEPFAGLVFRLPPSGSAGISAMMHGGALLGMGLIGALGARASRKGAFGLRFWVAGGCLGSAAALIALAVGGLVGPGFPLGPVAAALGLSNGVFAVSAVGAMMGLAGAAGGDREGVRMGVWGAAQAGGFAIGGFLGAVGVDILRAVFGHAPAAFAGVFVLEAAGFLVAAVIALRLEAAAAPARSAVDLQLEGAR